MKTKFFALVLLAALVSQSRAAIPPVGKILPDDTLFVMTAPDVDKMLELRKSSPQSQLWSDPAMKPFADKFMGKLNESLVAPLERELGVHLDDYTSLPHGQFTLAITRSGGNDSKSPGVVILVDTKAKSAQLKTNLTNLRKKWVDAGKTLQTEKLHDVEFTVLSLSGNDVPKTLKKFFGGAAADSTAADGSDKKDAPKDKLVFGQFDSLLIIGNTTKAVDIIATRLAGGSAPVLSDVAAFEADQAAIFRDAPFYAWVNIRAILDWASASSQPAKDSPDAAPAPAPTWKKIINATGLGGLKSIALGYQDTGDGYIMQFFLRIPESSRQGLLKVIAGDAKESSPPPFVPADVVKFQRWRLDGQKAFAALEKMAVDISPSAGNSINFMIESANAAARDKDPDYDLRKNLIGNLGSDIVTYQKAPRDTTLAALSSAPSIFLIGSPNAEKFIGSLQGLLRLMSPATPTEREFLGHKIYTATVPSNPVGLPAPGQPMTRNLSYAASSGYVAFSTDAGILEEFLRSSANPPKPLRETPGLTEAAQRVAGTSTGWFGYQNQSEIMRVMFEAVKKNASSTNGAGADPFTAAFAGIPGIGNNLKEWMDFSLLPGFDKVSKYFYFTVFANSTTVDGISFKVFAPIPPLLKK